MYRQFPLSCPLQDDQIYHQGNKEKCHETHNHDAENLCRGIPGDDDTDEKDDKKEGYYVAFTRSGEWTIPCSLSTRFVWQSAWSRLPN
jgi:hypothetical protein